MKIKLPPKSRGIVEEVDGKNIVVVGANGSGKTRFGMRLVKDNQNVMHIFAQKSLSVPDSFSLTSIIDAEQGLRSGVIQVNTHNSTNRSSQEPFHTLNDYELLLRYLFADQASESIKFKDEYKADQSTEPPETKIDQVQKIWESIVTHKKIDFQDLKVSIADYAGKQGSDGERLILYIVGQVVCAKADAVLVIDEPENHVHKAVLKKLYDRLEALRADCTFVYLTHDVDFAVTRKSATCIWAKSYSEPGIWDYEVLSGDSPIPEHLYLELLGSRQDILFVEGDESSFDYRAYQLLFPDHTVKSVGSCGNVVIHTKSLTAQKDFHRLTVQGIVDRDRMSEQEVRAMKNRGVWVLKVSEIENLFLVEEIVEAVSERFGKGSIFNDVRQNVITYFATEIENQKKLFFVEILKNKLATLTQVGGSAQNDVIAKIDTTYTEIDKDGIWKSVSDDLDAINQRSDYLEILRTLNNKGIIGKSGILPMLGIATAKEFKEQALVSLAGDAELSKSLIKYIDQ